MIDFDKLLFRASANGDIMTVGKNDELTPNQIETVAEYQAKKKTEKGLTDKQATELERLIEKRDNPQLSQTVITRLIKMYSQVLGRIDEIKSKFLDKGSKQEDEAITLYSLIKKRAYFKNDIQLSNKYVCGMPDLGDGDTLLESEEIIDTKCSWSLITFLKAKFEPLNADYEWQILTYLGLVPKAKRGKIAYCLVNAPAEIIVAEKRKLLWSGDFIDPDVSPEYKLKAQQVERNHIFDLQLFIENNPNFEFDSDIENWTYDIPREERVFEVIIERDNDKINKLYKKVERCREWMKEKFKQKAS